MAQRSTDPFRTHEVGALTFTLRRDQVLPEKSWTECAVSSDGAEVGRIDGVLTDAQMQLVVAAYREGWRRGHGIGVEEVRAQVASALGVARR